MVNTVGSYKNKHESKKWLERKRSLSLTSIQRNFIIGSLMGDGTMRIGKGAINANFKVEHCLAQRDYVDWKYTILKSFVFTPPKLSYRYDENHTKYPKSWWFRTIRHPELTSIYHRFYTGDGYKTGHKIIPENIIDDLTPFAAAILIMDDGSYNKGCIDISTHSFYLNEIEKLAHAFSINIGAKAKIRNDSDKGLRMYFSKSETDILIESIYSYIIPSMEYKIGIL